MSRLVQISGKEMCKLLGKLGFSAVHQVGSHVRLVHPDGRRTVVPVHGNEDLTIGLLREILKQAEISRKDYERLRR
ncbi:MAG TPA: type II toxin-antitoxin system HicA family toxin [Candidatus Diapherotrites archaeon]|uniref:Type II toxin-antitoxin system HicA family toxin n=1 Tax=Candidatus Iainarchaeum sp. TaxID=3101447 RepID=A0A7J4J231_9ARCH|nr:type II toxin-antitoxin system HicA family toxin [Candidatus Diapherotrites archaeon]